MPGGAALIIANGAELIAPITIGNIPKVAGITPPLLDNSILLQGLDGAVSYIQVGAAAVSAVGATATFRTKGGIISEGLGVDTLVMGRAASAGNAGNLRGIAIGALANCATNDAVVVGYNASAGTSGSVAIGYQSGAVSTEAITIGFSAYGQGNAGGAQVIAIGTQANAQASGAGGQDSLAFGHQSVARAYDTVIGNNASSSVQSVFGNNNVVIGRNAASNVAQGGNTVVGASSTASAQFVVIVGQGSSASAAANRAIIIGSGTAATHAHVFLVGHGAPSFQANTAVLGGTDTIINTVVIGSGNTMVTPAAKVVRFTNASGVDNAAGNVTWDAPLSTGAAAAAKHVFRTGIAHVSDAVLQTATIILELDTVNGGNFGALPVSGGAASFTTLAASGKITSTVGNNLIFLDSVSATTGYTSMHVKNTSAWLILGIEGSAAGTMVTNDTAYSTCLVTQNATDLILGTDQAMRVKIAHTTGAVTMSSLAGVGTRNVVVDANGVLSAP